MKYLPFERITYRTNLSEQEVITRLSGFTEAKKFGFRNKNRKDYEGSIGTGSFEINRIIEYRNSFIPQISGVIKNNNRETEIEVTMQLNLFVLVFLTGWCGFAILFLFTVLTREKMASFVFLIPIGMLLFVYALTMFGFKWESRNSKEYLKQKFEAEIIRE